MPNMKGIQLFKKLAITSVMKILLTGKADLKLTLDAFNRGLADKFLIKTIAGKIKYFICLLERQFDGYLSFANTSRVPSKVLDGLKNRTHAPVFISEENQKLPAADWEKIFYPFRKKNGYYFCFVDAK